MGDAVVERDGLYYPYVHFDNEAWLKATLLFFPHLYRMVAPDFEPPRDTDFISRLRKTRVGHSPIIVHAELMTQTCETAQDVLVARINADMAADGPGMLARLGPEAARARMQPGDRWGYQMHEDKAAHRLIATLKTNGLAWSYHPEYPRYIEMHPDMGAAVLGSIAAACAADRGLAVLADGDHEASRRINNAVPNCDFEGIYDSFIKGVAARPVPQKAGGQALAEVILYRHCDVGDITPEALEALGQEREPLARLKAELEKLASEIPAMLDQDQLDKELEARAQKALNNWQGDRLNLSSYLRRFFGVEALKDVGDLVKDLMKKRFEGKADVVGLAAAGEAGHAASQYLGALGGFGVGVVVHGASTFANAAQKARKSPYRYLSLAEKAGVAFSIGSRPMEAAEPHGRKDWDPAAALP